MAANRRLLADALELRPSDVSYINQVHGARVAVVDGAWDGPAPEADALVTTQPLRALAVLVADCVPVLLADPEAGVVAVAHAGRPGLAAGVVPAVVEAMRDLGARKLIARIGTAVCGRCYEVPADMRAEVASAVPETWAVSRAGTPALDLPGGVVAQLHAVGADVQNVATCTMEDELSFSYRRKPVTGRFAGVAWLCQA